MSPPRVPDRGSTQDRARDKRLKALAREGRHKKKGPRQESGRASQSGSESAAKKAAVKKTAPRKAAAQKGRTRKAATIKRPRLRKATAKRPAKKARHEKGPEEMVAARALKAIVASASRAMRNFAEADFIKGRAQFSDPYY
jgi:hypothetical protein